MRHLFIVNPAAGTTVSTRRLLEQLDCLSFPHETMLTQKVGDAQKLAQDAAMQGNVRIYACGGDGTLNEVVNGAAGYATTAITCVPKGTGNDFLKLFGKDYKKQFSNIEQLAKGAEVELDVMDCNGRLGLDVVCCGVDSRIAAGVHRYKKLPFLRGSSTYLCSLLEQVVFHGLHCPMKITIGTQTIEEAVTLLCICNGRYYGGGFMPVADATPNDGIFDMLVVRQVNLSTFLRLIGDYARGNYRKYPDLIREFHGQTISWQSEQELVSVIDGEVIKSKSFTLRKSPKTLRFFYPDGVSFGRESSTQKQRL